MVKPGYQQTEVGLLPEEWEIMPLGEIGSVRMCKRVLKHQTSEHGDVPFYKIGTFGSVADAFIGQSLFNEYKQKYSFPRKGDVLISAAGTIGRTVVYDGEPAYFQDSNIVWIENDASKVSNEYLWHRYQITKWSVSHGGTVARLYNDNLRTKIFIPVPSPTEQQAIASALSDTDELIGSLEQILTKKRQIKQGAMQELLTGKKRLPGFTGQWEVKKLGEISEIIMGQSPSSSNYNTNGVGLPLIQGNADIKSRVTIKRIYTTQITKKGKSGDILLSVRAPVGEISRALFDVCLGRGVCAIRYSNEFLYHCLINLEPTWVKHSKGSTFDSVNSTDVKALEILLPAEISEQIAIAEVLSDMDSEIEALENKLTKARQVKQGMMQELLTGKTRLV